jgi:hypothetical protein
MNLRVAQATRIEENGDAALPISASGDGLESLRRL